MHSYIVFLHEKNFKYVENQVKKYIKQNRSVIKNSQLYEFIFISIPMAPFRGSKAYHFCY